MRFNISPVIRFFTYSILFILVIGLGLLGSIPASKLYMPEDLPQVNNSQALAIDNVHLITMKGNEVLKNRQVLIEDGRISEIRAAGTKTGPTFKLVDAYGNWLIPGLFDMHVHSYDRKYQLLSLSYGVTSVRNMSGFPMHLRWRKELENNEWLGSRLFLSSPILNGAESSDPLFQVIVESMENAREKVRQYKKDGWDYIKVYEDLDADVYQVIVEEAESLNLPVVGHLPYSIVNKDYILARSMRTLEHAEEVFDGPLHYTFDNDKLENSAKQLGSIQATVTPTLMVFDHLTKISTEKSAYLDKQAVQYLSPVVKFIMDKTDVARWLQADDETAKYNNQLNRYLSHVVEVLHKHDVNMILGSDSGVMYAVQGLATHTEMQLLQSAGLSPWEILRMGTINAARAAGVESILGTIEPDKIADLVLVEQNPLFDVSYLKEPRAVIMEGQILDREQLLGLRESALYQSGAFVSIGYLLDFLVQK